ncbi:expansin module family protein [Trichoderma austrokoningii]
MFAESAFIVLAAVASVASALPSSEPPSRVESSPRAKRTTHYGLATVYDQLGAAGSCGQVHADSDYVAALTPTWQGTSWPPKYCGRQVFITNTGSGDGVGGKGNSVTVTVADTCPGCPSVDSIDLSRGAFGSLTNGATTGNVNIDWHFCNVNGQC